MARTDTLPHFLTDVADAIRTKKGTSGTIVASTFDTEISNLPSGSNFSISNGRYLFYNGVRLDKLNDYVAQFKNLTTAEDMFNSCSNLTSVPLFDTSSTIRMNNMFAYCKNLTSVPLYDTSSVTTMETMFDRCQSLTTVPLFNTQNVNYWYHTFNNCTNLSNDSLNNILLMCANSSATSGKTLRSLGLTSAQATTCQSLSNYQTFLNAGWTTGY